jgi:hypothetical protein
MGAPDKDDKLDSGSQFGKKGACQWNHSGQLRGWLAAPTGQEHLGNIHRYFLIANLELEFNLSPKRISKLKISNRKYMTIFQSENWAASDVHRASPANSRDKTARSSQFLIATDDPTRIGFLTDQRESKELSQDPAKILQKAESPDFLIATLAISEKYSTYSKQTTKQISNSNKSGFLPFCSLRDATRATGPSHA